MSTYLTKPSVLAPEGVRVFEVNGVPFDFRAGGWSENLFLHYSAADLANQIAILKSMGINGIRTEGKEMPQNFYDQMDRAGILIDAGFQCCDKWEPSGSGRGVSAQDYHVMYESSLTIGERLRDHPSVLNYSWSDNSPINEQETASLAGFSQSGFQDPIISSAEYNVAGVLGPSGEKEGPYDWVPPDYWYDNAHSSNNGNDNDSTLTNVGGAWGFDSEEGSGDTVPTMDSLSRFMSPADQATLWQQPDAHQFHTNYESTDGSHSGYSFGTLDNLDTAIKARYGSWSSLPQYVQEAQVQNYEDIRAQFEAYIDHWANAQTPSTGTDYWQLNKGWPTLLWDLYNSDYDEAGSYFGAKKANEDLHVLYAYDTGQVTIDNLTGARQQGLSVQSKVYGAGRHRAGRPVHRPAAVAGAAAGQRRRADTAGARRHHPADARQDLLRRADPAAARRGRGPERVLAVDPAGRDRLVVHRGQPAGRQRRPAEPVRRHDRAAAPPSGPSRRRPCAWSSRRARTSGRGCRRRCRRPRRRPASRASSRRAALSKQAGVDRDARASRGGASW